MRQVLTALLFALITPVSILTMAHDEGNFQLPRPTINDEQPFVHEYMDVLNSSMAYIDVGKGDPVIFLHGNPTSSYLWRNVIPFVSDTHRAIAPDLIGMGKSGKPDIGYTFQEHYTYLSTFIDQLGLNNITLVIHDWGAALGFEYARLNRKKVKKIAFMEGVLPPTFPQDSVDDLGPNLAETFRLLRDPIIGPELVLNQNFFVEVILPSAVNRTLSEQAMAEYRSPYPTPESRRPTLQWPVELPIGGEPARNVKLMHKIKRFMSHTKKPILFLYANPGAIAGDNAREWYEDHIKNLETAYIGQGIHFIQEDEPESIGRAVSEWLRRHP